MSSSTIQDISIKVGSGITPSRSNPKFWDSADYCWLKTEQIGEFEIYDTSEYISIEALKATTIKLWPPHTITIAMYGEGRTRGKVSILMQEMATNQACCNIIVNDSKIDYRYLYYWLFSKYEYLRGLSTGVRNNLNANVIREIEIYYPILSIQKSISELLYNIDRKIALNNAINAELEKAAKLLYNYWFVQFDFPNAEGKPYRASGGKMVYNEQLKRNIPKGWQVEQLKNILTIRSGYPFPSSSYSNHGKYKLITIKNVQDDGVNLETDNYINEIPSNLPDYCKIQVGDILLSLTGNVGRVGIMFGEGCLLNQRVATLDINNKQLKPFVYYLFSGGILRQTMLNMALGSSQANLSPVDTGEVFILFNNEYAKKFSTTVEHIYNQIVANHQQNKELTALRDFLLPLLMNGQVTVTAG